MQPINQPNKSIHIVVRWPLQVQRIQRLPRKLLESKSCTRVFAANVWYVLTMPAGQGHAEKVGEGGLRVRDTRPRPDGSEEHPREASCEFPLCRSDGTIYTPWQQATNSLSTRHVQGHAYETYAVDYSPTTAATNNITYHERVQKGYTYGTLRRLLAKSSVTKSTFG